MNPPSDELKPEAPTPESVAAPEPTTLEAAPVAPAAVRPDGAPELPWQPPAPGHSARSDDAIQPLSVGLQLGLLGVILSVPVALYFLPVGAVWLTAVVALLVIWSVASASNRHTTARVSLGLLLFVALAPVAVFLFVFASCFLGSGKL